MVRPLEVSVDISSSCKINEPAKLQLDSKLSRVHTLKGPGNVGRLKYKLQPESDGRRFHPLLCSMISLTILAPVKFRNTIH